MTSLRIAYEEAKEKGLIKTDRIWFNLGHHYSYEASKYADESAEIPFHSLPSEVKKMKVSESPFQHDFDCKCWWIENDQICVGKDDNPISGKLKEIIQSL